MAKQLLTMIAVIISSITVAQNINFTSNELYPEGVSYSKKLNVFFVTSLHYGTVGKVDMKGNYTPFINDSVLVSAIGCKVDEVTNTLYVASSDPGVSVKTNGTTQFKHAKLVAYDIATGRRKFIADLGALSPGGGNFANDIAIDKAGNIYVTNSASPLIYKITKKGKASIFATSVLWEGDGFNLNGIAYHPNGYLIVAKSNSGTLYKVDLKDPSKVSQITANKFPGADGLVINGKNELLVISNESNKVYQLYSADDWATSTEKNSKESVTKFLTTGTIANGKYYVLNAKLNEIFTPGTKLTSDFVIQEVKF